MRHVRKFFNQDTFFRSITDFCKGGLDVTPTTIQRFTACGDEVSASLIKQILKDEITHVAAGVKWFSYISRQRFPDQVRSYAAFVCFSSRSDNKTY